MKTKTTALAFVSAVFLCSSLCSSAFAQAPVVDRAVVEQNISSSDQSSAARNNYLEIQALREEVSSLRGLIEELSYELRKMQRRQDEDYQDLDRRLSSGAVASPDSATAGANVGQNIPPVAGSSTPSVVPGSSATAEESVDQLYRSGFNALRDGNRAEAVRVFQELVTQHPGSVREADALYWLGETHWLDLEIEKSRQSFSQLLEAYPGYRKASDAQYRLGLIYSQLGEQEKALQYMRALAEGGSSQAAAAKAYLEENGAL